jgi:hypothetical protein
MEFAYKNGTVINPNKDVVGEGGVKHPSRILADWSRDELQAIGVVQRREVHENRDPLLYVLSDAVIDIGEDEVVVTHSGIARPLADAKAAMTKDIKDQARARLSDTDWYVTRLAEKTTAIPAPITTYRNAVRAVTNTVEGQINAAGSVSALAAITINWPDEV